MLISDTTYGLPQLRRSTVAHRLLPLLDRGGPYVGWARWRNISEGPSTSLQGLVIACEQGRLPWKVNISPRSHPNPFWTRYQHREDRDDGESTQHQDNPIYSYPHLPNITAPDIPTAPLAIAMADNLGPGTADLGPEVTAWRSASPSSPTERGNYSIGLRSIMCV